jgi:hypothetical protein
MRVRSTFAVAAVLSALTPLAVEPAARADGADEVEMTAALSGKEIVPGPGPEGGSGTALVEADADEDRLCYDLTYQGISKPTAASVRRGAVGRNGPIEADFDITKSGDKNCITIDEAILKRIGANPAGYYVLVSTNEYPDGAIRGQLEKKQG